MNRRKILIPISLIVLIVIALAIPVAYHRFELFVTGRHHRSVGIAITEWANELSDIRTPEQAVDGVNTLDYISNYYVPGEGYRCDAKIEKETAEKRRLAMLTIERALEQYSGEKFGGDISQWKAWAGHLPGTTSKPSYATSRGSNVTPHSGQIPRDRPTKR